MTDAMQTIREALEYAKVLYIRATLEYMPCKLYDDAIAALSTIDSLAVTPSEDDPCKGCIPPSMDFCGTLSKCPKPVQDDGKVETCKWYPQVSDEDDSDAYYESGCGFGFHFDDLESLESIKFRYCPKCGKLIEEATNGQ